MRFACAVTIASETCYLGPLRSWLEAALTLGGVGEECRSVRIACSMALTEAVTNAIVHAHGRRRSRPVRIELVVAPDRIVMEVVDTGDGIGKGARTDPAAMVTRGRGLFLIRRSMTRVTSRAEKGRHRLRMVLLS
jgi:anti-sigma regulatory factor (Ser/Thr protein kinase)